MHNREGENDGTPRHRQKALIGLSELAETRQYQTQNGGSQSNGYPRSVFNHSATGKIVRSEIIPQSTTKGFVPGVVIGVQKQIFG